MPSGRGDEQNLWKVSRERFFPDLAFESMDQLEDNLVDTLRFLEQSPHLIQSVTVYQWFIDALALLPHQYSN